MLVRSWIVFLLLYSMFANADRGAPVASSKFRPKKIEKLALRAYLEQIKNSKKYNENFTKEQISKVVKLDYKNIFSQKRVPKIVFSKTLQLRKEKQVLFSFSLYNSKKELVKKSKSSCYIMSLKKKKWKFKGVLEDCIQ